MNEEEVAVCVAEIQTDIKWIRNEMTGFKEVFAPKLRYEIVEKLVFGLVGIVMISFITAVGWGVTKAADLIINY